MKTTTPRYKLFSVTGADDSGRWKITLQTPDEDVRLEVDEYEPDVSGERLALLSVVRGLEALDEPAAVEVHTPSVYVREGIRYGLQQWRANDWQWESFGQMVPVKNIDLWQRVDRALRFHHVECRTWRVDPLHGCPPPSAALSWEPSTESPREPDETKVGFLQGWKRRWERFSTRIRYRIAIGLQELRQAIVIQPKDTPI
ncbi:MAG: hypothetical protein PVH19_13500 [Planctomycetia bacterium]|jgi:ribonuclease HI